MLEELMAIKKSNASGSTTHAFDFDFELTIKTTPAITHPICQNTTMNCRPKCGACCIAPSISSPIPGMPNGKPARTPCVQLDGDMKCKIFGHPERPEVCHQLQPFEDMCLDTREQALRHLGWLDDETS